MRFAAAAKQSIGIVAFLSALGWAAEVHAQLGIGTWARTDAHGMGMTMTVESCCRGGYRITYHIPGMGGQPPATMSVDSPMDGTEAPALVNGKPSGETMAVKRVDDHHYSATMQMGGKPFGTANGTLSADGKTLTVESVSEMGGVTKKVIETWVRK